MNETVELPLQSINMKKISSSEMIFHHYLMIALAGDEIKTKADEKMKDSERHVAIMYLSYERFSNLYASNNLPEVQNVLSPIEGMTVNHLMEACKSHSRTKEKTGMEKIGEGLWRKFSECVCYNINHVNKHWVDTPPSGKTRADILENIKQYLWNEKEEENLISKVKEGKSYVKKSYNSSWKPKECFVFLACGLPAGTNKKFSFIEKSASNGPRKGTASEISYSIAQEQADIAALGSRSQRKNLFMMRNVMPFTTPVKDGSIVDVATVGSTSSSSAADSVLLLSTTTITPIDWRSEY
jgi:hypothetical protein